MTHEPGDAFYISGSSGNPGAWIANDNLFVNGEDVGAGFAGDKGLGFPAGVPVDSILFPVNALDVTAPIPLGSASVEFRLADLERDIYGNTDIYLVKIAQPPILSVPGDSQAGLLRVAVAPNPVRASAVFRVAGAQGTASVRILDSLGRLVRELAVRAGGEYAEISWDGRDEHGDRVPSGVYHALVVSGTRRGATKLVVIR